MKLPVPQRGQPLDVSFMNQVVTSINSLWDKLVISASAYASLWTDQGRKAIKASEVKIVTGKMDIAIATGTAATQQTFTYTFDIAFKYPPIVTATPSSINAATAATKGLRAILTEVQTSHVKGIVVFENGSEASTTSVHIIAVGVPS